MRRETHEKITAYERDEIARLQFGKVAKTYSDASWPESAKGIEAPEESYAVTHSLSKDIFTFTFKGKNGKTGTLSFAMPTKLEQLMVDRQPSASSGDPALYKEWRLSASVTGTGIFAGTKSKTPPTARLIFHGSGNACTDATQFSHWTLEVNGANAGFRFFGSLAKPKP